MTDTVNRLSNHDLAHRLVAAEEQGDADTQAECLNEICGRLNLSLDLTELGLTNEANRQIDLWVDANWTEVAGDDG